MSYRWNKSESRSLVNIAIAEECSHFQYYRIIIKTAVT